MQPGQGDGNYILGSLIRLVNATYGASLLKLMAGMPEHLFRVFDPYSPEEGQVMGMIRAKIGATAKAVAF